MAFFTSALRYLAGFGVVATSGTILATSFYLDLPLEDSVTQSKRLVRSLAISSLIASDFKFSLRNEPDRIADAIRSGSAALDTSINKEELSHWVAIRERVLLRSARRLLHLCTENGGLYIKAGQYIASWNHAVPRAFTQTLSSLQDKATTRTFDSVNETIKEEFGKDATKLFREFDQTPIASASLAQVHRAVTQSGEEVAVKVQHRSLRKIIDLDLKTINLLLLVTEKFFPHFEYRWIMPEFRGSLDQELDFRKEAENSRKIATFFRDNPHIHIPHTIKELTTSKVLTMEFIHAIKITDLEKIQESRLDKGKVLTNLISLFSDQIFRFGFIHCDPHPGNIMVRRMPKSAPHSDDSQIVLLDHGLYRELSETTRKDYCLLWRAILRQDYEQIEQLSKRFGAGKFTDLFTLMLTHAPPGTKNLDSTRSLSREEREKIREMLKQFSGDEDTMANFFKNISRDLLYIMRSTNLIMSINRELGQINRFEIMVKKSIEGIHAKREDSKSTNRVDKDSFLGLCLVPAVKILTVNLSTEQQFLNQ